jgi:hypothetical protein
VLAGDEAPAEVGGLIRGLLPWLARRKLAQLKAALKVW